MNDSKETGPFGLLGVALKTARRDFASLLFYGLLMSGVTALLYFPVLSFYGHTFDVFYGKVAFDPSDVNAGLDLLGTLAYLLPSFFAYLFAMAAFWVSWVARHGVRKAETRAGFTPANAAKRSAIAGLKTLGAIGWWGLLIMPTIFIIGALFGMDGQLSAAAEVILYFAALAIGMLTLLPVGLSIATTARGGSLSAFRAFRQLKGKRITGALAVGALFLIPAILRTELGIWFIDEGWLGETQRTGTLAFLLIATFTESLVMLIWMSFSDAASDQISG